MSEVPPVEPRKLPRQARARATVDALVEATARILVEEGVEGVSTNRIAKEAGVSIGSLYQYFPNKDALVIAVAKRHTEHMLAMLQRYIQDMAGASVEEAVESYVTAMFAAHRLEPELHAALLPYFLKDNMEHFESHQRRILAVVRVWLELHRLEILPDDLDAASLVLVTAVETATHSAFLGFGSTPEAVEREVKALVLRYLRGATPPA